MTRNNNYIKIIPTLSTKVAIFYLQAFIVQVETFKSEGVIAGYHACLKLVIFLALEK